MEAEEDLFVVIVGDSSDSQYLNHTKLEPVENQQITNEPVENILKQASQYGTFLNTDEIKVQLRQYEELEYLEEGVNLDQHAKDVLKDVATEIELNDSQNNEVKSVSPKKSKPSRSTGRSVVAELRDTYPELQQEEFLVDTVKELMKNQRPPPLPIHYCKHVVNKKFQCTKCDVISVTLMVAGRHYQENHGPRYLTCFACGASFRRKDELYKHEQICESPDAAIVLKARDIHLGWYATERRITKMCKKKILQSDSICPVCYAQFADVETKNIHTKTAHSELLRPYKCEHCNASFKLPSIQRTHVKTFHGNQMFICDICSRSFKTKPYLISHLETHIGVKNYVCHQCPNRYTLRCSLIKHINKIHKQLPPNAVCHICHKRFYGTYELNKHLKKVHNSTVITARSFINKKLTMKDPLIKNAKLINKQYVNELSNESLQQYYEEKKKKQQELEKKKRFSCAECDKKYVLKTDLKLHIEAMHSGEHRPVRCQVCQNVYRRMDLLKRHMKTQHKMMLMSPELFQKALPNLSKAQIEEAQIVLKPPSKVDTS